MKVSSYWCSAVHYYILPLSHFSPVHPGLQPALQWPVIRLHFLSCLQCPHVPKHSKPNEKAGHAENKLKQNTVHIMSYKMYTGICQQNAQYIQTKIEINLAKMNAFFCNLFLSCNLWLLKYNTDLSLRRNK